MGKKSIMNMLLTLGFFQVVCAFAITGFSLLIGFFLIQQGVIYPPGKSGEIITTLTQMIEDDVLLSEEIPDLIGYARITSSGEFVEGTIQNNSLIQQVIKEGRISKGYILHGITYIYVPGEEEGWIFEYSDTVSQFSNPFLRKILPSADFAFLLFLLIALSTTFFKILQNYKKTLNNELKKILNIQETILEENQIFSNVTSSIREVDEILIVLKVMEKKVKETMQKQVQQSNDLEEGIQALTHDIQTPASVVLGNIELLEESKMDEEQNEYLHYAKEGICRISEYVKELKNLSNLESRKKKSPLIQKFIFELVDIAKEITSMKKISLIVQLTQYDESLLINIKDVEKAFQNILVNAVDYSTPQGKVFLNFEKDGDNFVISVEDRGKGFSRESLAKATEKFYSENSSRTKDHYGLGLAIVEKIMKDHQGNVKIENVIKDNRIIGAKVSLVFPVKL